LKVTVPKTVAVLGVSVTVAVSVAEPPKVMGVGETLVVILVPITSRLSPVSPQLVEAG